MYDLAEEPLERVKLAWSGCTRTPAQEAQFLRLRAKLAEVRRTRLAPPPS